MHDRCKILLWIVLVTYSLEVYILLGMYLVSFHLGIWVYNCSCSWILLTFFFELWCDTYDYTCNANLLLRYFQIYQGKCSLKNVECMDKPLLSLIVQTQDAGICIHCDVWQ